jgi:hypothetical protein
MDTGTCLSIFFRHRWMTPTEVVVLQHTAPEIAILVAQNTLMRQAGGTMRIPNVRLEFTTLHTPS